MIRLPSDEYLPVVPVDVVQGKGHDFARPEPETGEQHQDGVAAPPDVTAPVAALEQTVHM